ncbi:hypothetical protein KBC03_00910 [Patescibacteria group bacterium]|nr:hypothetical protein [Patescibacteria group bacterium]
MAQQNEMQKELSFVMLWLQKISKGDTAFKKYIVKILEETKGFLKGNLNYYTIDRGYFHTIVFLIEITKWDDDLKKWIMEFDEEKATAEEYKALHASMEAYQQHLTVAQLHFAA